MDVMKSNKNIRLGKDYELRFGDKKLTLDAGFMTIGGKLPSTNNMVNPDLKFVEIPVGIRKIILTVPSLDTPVCESQIKNLSQYLKEQDISSTVYYVVSVDTPFAQARFIKENNISSKINFISDYADHRFMCETGLRIIELNVFARSLIECDEQNSIIDVTIPEDITQIP